MIFKKHYAKNLSVLMIIGLILVFSLGCYSQNFLPSEGEIYLSAWNDSQIKTRIINYVETVTDPNSKSFVPEEDRIAVFDMDGTIICERPVWLEMRVALDYLYQEGIKNPDLLKEEKYQIATEYCKNPLDQAVISKLLSNEDLITDILKSAYKGESQEVYVNAAEEYTANTKNASYNIPLWQTFYRPMVELFTYLLNNHFQVYIVSGSEQGLIWGVCLNRLPLDRAHMIGSEMAYEYKIIEGHQSVFLRQGEYVDPRNLEAGKCENIYYHIGKQPIFAFGNSDGDFEMLEYAVNNKYLSVAFLLVHDDAAREYNYPDDKTKKEWSMLAETNGWHQVSIKNDFKQVFINQ